jgi:uncharacterized membrane protein YraQ (UPF0718 family)/copper chaperone CopZ
VQDEDYTVFRAVEHFGLECWRVTLELAPWLLIGAAVAGVMHAVLPTGFVRRRLQGYGGVMTAVIFGVPLPLCSCGVIPTGLGLKEDGASDGATIGFMISTPQTGVDSVVVSAAFLGMPFAIFKVFSAAIMGVVGGGLAEALSDDDPDLVLAKEGQGLRPGIRSGIEHGLTVLRSIWRWLVLGVLLSAAITVWLPPTILSSVGDWGPLGAGLAALALSLPLYVCATASVPIAAALVAGGLPLSAALVFLMAGPATNVATIGAVYRGMGHRNLAIYLGTIIVGSLTLGVMFDSVLQGAPAAVDMGHMQHNGVSAYLAAVALMGLCGWFALSDMRAWLGVKKMERDIHTHHMVIAVEGMTCNGCTSRLARLLNAVEGVEQAVVTLEPGQATVQGDLQLETIHGIITGAGFDVVDG